MSLWFRTDAQCPAFIQACTESDGNVSLSLLPFSVILAVLLKFTVQNND